MHVVVAGGTGLVGRALVPALAARGHQVTVLVRGAAQNAHERAWRPDGAAPVDLIGAADAVVNLAGAGIADRRWTRARRQILVESRTGPTRALVEALARTGRPGRCLVNASAYGFYGDTGEGTVTEVLPQGTGFLADLCAQWEAEARRAEAIGHRVVCARFGIILGQGGALAQIVPLFRWGLGGRLGSGRQWMSWIALSDAVAGLIFALETGSVHGPVNFCSPQPVRNKDFTVALARALHRPVSLPAPKIALRLLVGAMADEGLLSSCRALPAALVDAGFEFGRIPLQDALSEGLARP